MDHSVPKCGICNRRHRVTSSTVWCFECEEGFCNVCGNYHSLSKASRRHKTISIIEYLELPIGVRDVKQLCSCHEEKILSFCREHACPCCRRCAQENHKKCQDVDTIDDLIRGIKTSTTIVDLEKALGTTAENLNKVKTEKQENIRRLNEHRNEIKEKVRNMKTDIINHIGALENSLFQELDQIVDSITLEINFILNSVSEREFLILNIQKVLEVIKRAGSELQTFLISKQAEKSITTTEKSLLAMETAGIIGKTQLQFSFDDEVQNLASNIKRLGKIETNETENNQPSKPQDIKSAAPGAAPGAATKQVISKEDIDQIKQALSDSLKKQNSSIGHLSEEQYSPYIESQTHLKHHVPSHSQLKLQLSKQGLPSIDSLSQSSIKQGLPSIDSSSQSSMKQGLPIIDSSSPSSIKQGLPSNNSLSQTSSKQQTNPESTTYIHMIPRCIHDIKLTLKQKITTNGKNIRGITTLPGSRIAFSSFTDRMVTVVDSNGTEVSTFPTPAGAFDLAFVANENKIAVSSGGNLPCIISLLDFAQNDKIKSVKFDSYIYGIAADDNSIIASVKGSGMFKVTFNSGSHETVQRMMGFEALNGFDTYVDVSGEKIYVSSWFSGKVVGHDTSGNVLWSYDCKKEIGKPFGIAVDAHGYSYVVGEHSSVGVISANGQHFRVILSKGEGPEHPRAIHYDAPNHELLVASFNRHIFRYSIGCLSE